MKFLFNGGLNENEALDPSECQEGENFELTTGDTDFRPRPPLDLSGTAPLAGNICGIMQLVKRDDSETTIIFEDDGATPTIYEWDGASTFTSKRTLNLGIGSKLRDSYWSLDDYLIITDINKLTPLLNWDGTSCTRHKTNLFVGSAQSVVGLTSSGTTATAVVTAHGYSNGDLVQIAGANETEYNGEYEISNVTVNTFDYTFAGSATSPATGTITVDLGVELFARYSVIHNGRLWLFNITTDSTELPHMLLASEFENPESFDTTTRSQDAGFSTGLEAFFILTKDLKPINGVFEFKSDLIISTLNGELYKLIGTDSTSYEFVDFYMGSAAIGTEAFANIGNDAVFIREGGNIESLQSTDQYGDVRVDDISRWIPKTIRDINEALIVYDRYNQKVLFFVGSKVLVLFKDQLYSQSGLSPWSIYTTQDDCNFDTFCGKFIRRPGTTNFTVYIGCGSGKIFDMNGQTDGDDGSNIKTFRRTRYLDEIDVKTSTVQGRVQYRRVGRCDLNLEFDWSDSFYKTDCTVVLKGPTTTDLLYTYYGGPGVYSGTADPASSVNGPPYYNQGFIGLDAQAHRAFSPAGRSETFTMLASIDSTVQFRVDNIEIPREDILL